MAPESISTVYFIYLSHQSVCLYVHLPSPFVARFSLSKHFPASANTCNNRRIVGRVCLWVCLCIPLLSLGNNSVKTFPWQRRIVRGVVSYAVRAVSKECRQLVLPRTSCLLCDIVSSLLKFWIFKKSGSGRCPVLPQPEAHVSTFIE
jgi:hypothetical protein